VGPSENKDYGGDSARKELDKRGAGSSDAITTRDETKEQRNLRHVCIQAPRSASHMRSTARWFSADCNVYF
jgi:hypothetical protein